MMAIPRKQADVCFKIISRLSLYTNNSFNLLSCILVCFAFLTNKIIFLFPKMFNLISLTEDYGRGRGLWPWQRAMNVAKGYGRGKGLWPWQKKRPRVLASPKMHGIRPTCQAIPCQSVYYRHQADETMSLSHDRVPLRQDTA